MTVLLVSVSLALGAVTGGADATRRTAVFLVLGAGQLGIAMALRSARRGVGLHGRWLELAAAGALLLMVAAVWLPPMRQLLGTHPLPLGLAAAALAAAAIPGLVLRAWRIRTARRRG